jgi:hypothetical protein
MELERVPNGAFYAVHLKSRAYLSMKPGNRAQVRSGCLFAKFCAKKPLSAQQPFADYLLRIDMSIAMGQKALWSYASEVIL